MSANEQLLETAKLSPEWLKDHEIGGRRFRMWLAAQPPTAEVGWSNSGENCPVFRWLTAEGAPVTHVYTWGVQWEMSGVLTQNVVSSWVQNFIGWLDALGEDPFRVPAQVALALVDAVLWEEDTLGA